MGLKKAIKRIETKIEFYHLLAEGQKNDGNICNGLETLFVIQGFQEALAILVAEYNPTVNIEKKLIKKANQYLSSESDKDTSQMIFSINEHRDKTYIDFIDGVQVAEKFENTFSPNEFLEQIGFSKILS